MRRYVPTLALIGLLLVAGLTTARAEITQSGDLRLSFNGRFNPQDLPRHRNAPISIDVGGSISTADGTRPPELRRIEIGVNRYGSVYTGGLPVCRPGQIQSVSSATAAEICRGALVGRGAFGANVDLSNTSFPVAGQILAFNSRRNGRSTMLVHVHGSRPVEATIVLTFQITRPERGRFGTMFTTRIPRIASDLGYVTELSLRLDRRFRHRGQPRSYLNARCAAPAGFPGGPFSFARGLFSFANGQNLAVTLTRNCRVR